MSAEKVFCCPNCRRPWDETEAAVQRMSRIARGERTLDDDIKEPGFVSDLRLVLQKLPAVRP